MRPVVYRALCWACFGGVNRALCWACVAGALAWAVVALFADYVGAPGAAWDSLAMAALMGVLAAVQSAKAGRK